MTPKMRTAIKAAMAAPQKKSAPVTSPLKALIGVIEHRISKGHDPNQIIEDLVKVEGARYSGTQVNAPSLRLAKIRATCTAGAHGLLANWCAAARRQLAKEATHADA